MSPKDWVAMVSLWLTLSTLVGTFLYKLLTRVDRIERRVRWIGKRVRAIDPDLQLAPAGVQQNALVAGRPAGPPAGGAGARG